MSTDRRMSPHMEQMAKRLATRYGMDWTQPGAYLMLAMPERPERWLLINMDGERFSLTCCLVEPDETLVPEVDMVFTLHTEGWEPIELLYSNEAFTAYVQVVEAAGQPVYDNERDLRFDTFTEYWAQVLEEQGWLQDSYRLPKPESGGRMAGCQSINHTDCYGELWQCQGCGKMVCYAEGTTNHPEVCDECWAVRFAPRSEVSFTQHGALQLICDCPERCGTVLKLSHDGFLLLADKDDLLVSFMLPDWLDFAIRRALLAHVAMVHQEVNSCAAGVVLRELEDDVPF